jgi:hypothetical protein
MPGCENILAVTAGWLISVCGFYVVSEDENFIYVVFFNG